MSKDNWYRISSNNIPFNKSIDELVIEISDAVFQYCLNQRIDIEYLGDAEHTNPYTNKVGSFFIAICPNKDKKCISDYSLETKTMNVYPYTSFDTTKIDTSTLTEQERQELYTNINEAMTHEILHTIDPKSSVEKYIELTRNTTPGTPEYFNLYTEFDAYSKQIYQHIVNNAKNEDYNKLFKWIESDKILSFPKILYPFENIITYWYDHDNDDNSENQDYIRKFKQRIWNDFFHKKTYERKLP